MHISKILSCVLVAGVSLLLSSCGTSKKIGAADIEKDSPEFFLNTLVTNQVNARWFSARARIDFEDEYMSVGGTANIRMLKDSLIWVSVRKLGFEVARAKITPDSVYIIDRLSNAYDIKGLEYLAQAYNIPGNFDVLQSLILGNPVFFTTKDLQIEKLEPMYRLYGRTDNMVTNYLIEDQSYRLRQMEFDDFRAERNVQMVLDDYQQLPDNQDFSYFRILEMNSEETGRVKIEMKYSQLEINVPKNVNFEIPARYTRTSY